ncbi:MAG: zf-TFIIB domain-containing protein [Acidobacteriota bacterium]
MNCPACDGQMNEKEAGGIKVDVCDGCGGIWFDQFELMKVDEPHESAGESLLEIGAGKSAVVRRDQQRACPRCDGMQLRRHFFSVKKDVEVDECPECGGIWLDAGELGSIRSQFDSDEDREKAADEYFEEIFGSQLAAMREESEEQAQKARRIAWAFRFICPSYYIPGEQKWGAF